MKQLREKENFIIYIFTCLLFLEWLYPTKIVMQLGDLHLFILFSILCFLLYYLHIPAIWKVCIKSLSAIGIIYIIFSEVDETIGKWLVLFWKRVAQNTQLILTGGWGNLTYEYRSLLLLFAIWFIIFFIRLISINKKRPMIFLILTIIYIGLIDIFTVWEGKFSIIRVMIIGYFLLSFTSIQRIFIQEKLLVPKTLWKKRLLATLCIVTLGVIIGIFAPKYDSVWPYSITTLHTQVEKITFEKGVATLGYREDDSKLGGPFKKNNQKVFEVESPSRQYWKVEVRDTYTGHGWETAKESEFTEEFYPDEWIPNEFMYMDSSDLAYAHVTVRLPYPHLVQPYSAVRVTGEIDGYFDYAEQNEKILSYDSSGEPVMLDEYTIEFYDRKYDVEQLRYADTYVEYDLMEQYTQLPDTLPQRVIDLAYEIIGNEDNWYDQAKAIEEYFQSNEFSYDNKKVPIPEEDEDYVDRFLFETKRGYCDNFSTSMIALLRAVDIPARWAKGYTGGTYKSEGEDGHSIFEVTNNDAHSWVEVYFPSEGWVPFEPTKGFNSNVDFIEEEEIDEEIVEDDIETEVPELQEETPEIEEEINNDSEELPFTNEKKMNKEIVWKVIGSILMILALLLAILWFNRKKWLPLYWIKLYVNKNDADTFISAYHVLLKQLAITGLKKADGQTLRNYAKAVDEYFESDEMSKLTATYERMTYRRTQFTDDWDKHKTDWEYIMRCTMKK